MATKRNTKPTRPAAPEAEADADGPTATQAAVNQAAGIKHPTDELLAGVEYADVPPVVDPNQRAEAGVDALQRAEEAQAEARAAIARAKAAAEAAGMPYAPALLGQKPLPPTPEERRVIEGRKKWYQVMAPAKIRRGAATYDLVAGKIFDNNQYDIESLRRQGVQLKEVDPRQIHVRPEF